MYVLKRNDDKYYFTSVEPEFGFGLEIPRVAFVDSIEECSRYDLNQIEIIKKKFEKYTTTCASWKDYTFTILEYKKEKRKQKIKKINESKLHKE